RPAPTSCCPTGSAACVDKAAWPPYNPRLPTSRKVRRTAGKGSDYEDHQLAEDREDARQELPPGAPQGPRLRDQQEEPALQGPPGLISTRPRRGACRRSFGAALPLGRAAF